MTNTMDQLLIDSIEYHEKAPAGKLGVVATKPLDTQKDLSMAYTPGVGKVCLEIEKDEENSFKYTSRKNMVAVITNGTAVLGLGNIGALASKPVMEGKAVLFKKFSGIDSIDLEIDETDPKRFIEIVKSLHKSFGGINLEDIAAPACFEIEDALKAELDIPVMHDDQHGTAIIATAGLINALDIAGKSIGDIKLIINGAGAGAIAVAKLLINMGLQKKNLIMLDSKGTISVRRNDLNKYKQEFVSDTESDTLDEAMIDADVFIGLSAANILKADHVKSMANNPIVFALANPVPEISYEEARNSRPDAIVATGLSNKPNQVNNVLGFPYIFRGAMDVRSKVINEEMKIAAVKSIAELAKSPVPSYIAEAYGVDQLSYGVDYFLPKPIDRRLITTVAPAVAEAAMETGVAKEPIPDWGIYKTELEELIS